MLLLSYSEALSAAVVTLHRFLSCFCIAHHLLRIQSRVAVSLVAFVKTSFKKKLSRRQINNLPGALYLAEQVFEQLCAFSALMLLCLFCNLC